jgi:hypothetical protein
MRKKVIFGFTLGATALVLLTPSGALAAMDATLSSTHARPGDSVLLLTEDYKGTWTYDGLSAENHQSIYLAPTTGAWADACGDVGSQRIGRLQWRGNTAGLSFVVPSLPLADYWLFMETSGQCWRIAGQQGGAHQPLVLSLGSTPADNQNVAAAWTIDSLPLPKQSTSQPAPASSSSGSTTPWLVLIGGTALLLLALFLSKSRTKLLM